ncbi:MAG TPA: flagellar export protein FliJ [Methylibium sp.]|nr:flagellar export protein FliJ [Methylibium sp.]
MDPLQPLASLLEQTRAERDLAFGDHLRLRRAAEAAQAQAEQLAGYRGDYARRFGGSFQRSGALELMQCYQGFMTRLDDAVAQQQRTVAQAAERADAARATLLAAELRVASVEKLVERRRAEASLAQQRREQKAGDELAARMSWQRGTAAALGGW